MLRHDAGGLSKNQGDMGLHKVFTGICKACGLGSPTACSFFGDYSVLGSIWGPL